MGTIVATSIGENSVQITSAGTNNTLTEFMQDVSDAITGVAPVRTTGWAVYDTFTSGIIKTQVYRALNKDGITYKYLIMKWNTMACEVNTSTCESWDTVAHVPTNEAWTFFDCAPITYRLSACDFVVNTNPRWAILTSYINGEPGLWAGVFETDREDVTDTPANGAPCWGWIASPLWGLGASVYNTKPLNTNDHTLICMPRTRSGATGVNAAKGWAGDYGVAQSPNWLATGASYFTFYLGNQGNKFLANAWDTTKRLILPIKPIFDYTQNYVTNYGTIFGLKVLAPVGNNMSKIPLNIDTDGNYSPSGVEKDHWVLNTHHKYDTVTAASWFGNTNLTLSTINLTERPDYFCSIGQAYYVVTPTKLKKINALLGTYTDFPLNTYYDLKYDGERYIYIGTPTGLVRLDTVDDSLLPLAITNGVQTMAINDTHIVCSQYGLSATPIITRVLRSSFTVDTVNGSVTLATFTEAVRITEVVANFDGSILMAANVATAGNFKLVSLPKSGAAPTYVTLNQVVCANVGIQLIDENTAILWQAVTTGVMYQVQFNPKTLLLTGSVQSIGTLSGLVGGLKLHYGKIQGVIFVVPRNAAAANATITTSLGKTITANLGAPVIQADGQTNLHTGLTTNAFFFWDGCRAISNHDVGLRIFGAVNGSYCYSGVTLGQIAIPA